MIDREGEPSELSKLPDVEARPLTPEQREQEEAELREFGDKLLPYLHRYMLHIQNVDDPAHPSHPDRLKYVGSRTRRIRKFVGLSRAELAQQMDEDPVRISAFEGGLIPFEDLPEGFSRKLSSVLVDRLLNTDLPAQKDK